jgi:hypothetical protein
MDISKFTEPRAFQVDGGWYDAYWLRQARPEAARSIARSIAGAVTRFRAWSISKFGNPSTFSEWLPFE